MITEEAMDIQTATIEQQNWFNTSVDKISRAYQVNVV